MTTTRRTFIDRLATGAVALGGLALAPELAYAGTIPGPAGAGNQQGRWDTSWAARMTGRVRAVIDSPDVESGIGVWRASLFAQQYSEGTGMPASEVSTALVLRHNGIVLAMSQAFWDRYGLSEYSKATHPLTGAVTPVNPALLGTEQGVPEPFANFTLPKFLQHGGIVLACNLAATFDLVPLVKAKDNVSDEVGHQRVVAGLIPGVILQPSGVFAAAYAQQAAQAQYIRSN